MRADAQTDRCYRVCTGCVMRLDGRNEECSTVFHWYHAKSLKQMLSVTYELNRKVICGLDTSSDFQSPQDALKKVTLVKLRSRPYFFAKAVQI